MGQFQVSEKSKLSWPCNFFFLSIGPTFYIPLINNRLKFKWLNYAGFFDIGIGMKILATYFLYFLLPVGPEMLLGQVVGLLGMEGLLWFNERESWCARVPEGPQEKAWHCNLLQGKQPSTWDAESLSVGSPTKMEEGQWSPDPIRPRRAQFIWPMEQSTTSYLIHGSIEFGTAV